MPQPHQKLVYGGYLDQCHQLSSAIPRRFDRGGSLQKGDNIDFLNRQWMDMLFSKPDEE